MENFTVDPTLARMQIPVPTHPRSLPQSVDTIGGFGLVFTAVRASIEAGNCQDEFNLFILQPTSTVDCFVRKR